MKSYNEANVKQESIAGQIFAPDYTAIPDELRKLQQWVGWKYVPNPGQPKPRKILVNPETGNWAKTDAPNTWSRLTKAMARYVRDELDGIGFVFTADDPYCGIDLDNVVDPLGALMPSAQGIIDRLDSYTEFSPSGMGAHIIVRAKLSGRGRKGNDIEIYDRGRYFTMTGQPTKSDGGPIPDRQNVVDALYGRKQPAKKLPRMGGDSRLLVGPELPDSKVIGCIQASPFGKTFSLLYGGGWESRYGSHSEADLALAGILATFVGNNPTQIDRIFRRSVLIRPKWDELRGDFTYGEMTINKALEK
jgi:putative DNA primase/helicase